MPTPFPSRPKHPLHADPLFRTVLSDLDDLFTKRISHWLRGSDYRSEEDGLTMTQFGIRLTELINSSSLEGFESDKKVPKEVERIAHTLALREIADLRNAEKNWDIPGVVYGIKEYDPRSNLHQTFHRGYKKTLSTIVECADRILLLSSAGLEWRNFCPSRCEEVPGRLVEVDYRLVVVPD